MQNSLLLPHRDQRFRPRFSVGFFRMLWHYWQPVTQLLTSAAKIGHAENG